MASKNLMALWSEFNPDSTRSMKEDFLEKPDYHVTELINYLRQGEITMVSPASSTDVFTNEMIVRTKCVQTDGEYSWLNTLPYYVETYNLCLPDDFVKKVLAK